tara:strand:+ start:184 stop:348 length:165 start_codon:yes stop_codon:yes gene_type:complete
MINNVEKYNSNFVLGIYKKNKKRPMLVKKMLVSLRIKVCCGFICLILSITKETM